MEILGKLATEGGTSVLQALAGPKLKRLSEWAAEKDLQNRVLNQRWYGGFWDYLESVRRRVSTLRTVVFPTRDVPITDLYEPVTLEIKRHATRPDLLRAVTAMDLQGRHLLIRDRAGMGKSTLLRYLALTALQDDRLIPILVELRRVPSDTSLLNTILSQLNIPGLSTDTELLLRLLHLGDFLLLFDGFDELPAARREALGWELLELVGKAPNNTVVVTTRPEAGAEMFTGFAEADIKPFGAEAAEALITRYDHLADAQHGKTLIPLLASVPHEFTSNPLLISLLYRTHASGGDVTEGRCSFYEDVFNALYRGHDLTKAAFRRDKSCGLDVAAFRQVLRAVAFHATLHSHFAFSSEFEAIQAMEAAARLTPFRDRGLSMASVLDDLLLAVPLMVRDGGELRWIHRSFVDYFTAEFLAYGPEPIELATRIRQSAHHRQFGSSLTYLAELQPEVFRVGFVCPVATAFLGLLERLPQELRDDRLASLFLGCERLAFWIGPMPDEITAVFPLPTDTEERLAAQRRLAEACGCQPNFVHRTWVGDTDEELAVVYQAHARYLPPAVVKEFVDADSEVYAVVEAVPEGLERRQWVTFHAGSDPQALARWRDVLLAVGRLQTRDHGEVVLCGKRAREALALCNSDIERRQALDDILGLAEGTKWTTEREEK